MSRHSLIVAASESARHLAERIATSTCEAWDAIGSVPSLEVVPIEHLLDRAVRSGRARWPSVLAVVGADAPSSLPAKLVDAMHRTLMPGVVLVPRMNKRCKRLEGGGVLVEGWGAKPTYLAAVLHALCERQRTVRELCDEMDRLSSFQGGLHGEMSRLHDELNLAAMIQRELLPKSVPSVPGVEFGVLFRPAGYVSGDIYDVSMIGSDRVGFFLADAVGHGVPAALLTVVISRSLRVSGGHGSADPSVSLARLNEEMIACQRETHRFATAVAGTLDLRSREVTLASAGHPPAIRVRTRGHEPIEDGGPLLGVFPDQEFPSVTFRLEDDETLLLYSDGFEVAFSDAKRAPKMPDHSYVERLCAMPWPDGDRRQGVRAAMDALEAELDRQSGSLHQVDDLTAMAIAPRVAAAHGRLDVAAA